MIKIDDWVIEKGEKAQGKIEITGCGMAMPATVICGVEDGPTILITAGVHSAEYVGIQAAMELAKEFQPEELKGNVIIIPLVNVSGFEHRTMSMVYEDGKNLNRVFPGDPEGTAADRIAYTMVTKLFSITDYYIDLHSGDGYEQLHPYVYYVGQDISVSNMWSALQLLQVVPIIMLLLLEFQAFSSRGADTVTGPGRKWNRTKETSVILCFIFRGRNVTD